MNVGLYQSASSLTALERWQDVVTQNISSDQVTGFKRRMAGFEGAAAKQFGANVEQSGQTGAAGPAIFPYSGYSVDFSRGEGLITRRDLDFAIEGNGFFQVEKADGTRAFTRSGSFHISGDRQIVNGEGDALLDQDGNAFQLLPGGGEIKMAENGALSQGGVPLGQVSVVDFDQPENLRPIGGSLFLAPEGTEPLPVENALVLQGRVEGSNVKPLREMVDLVNIARAYEANQKIIQTSDDIMKRTLETLG